ncbi:MAG TPA: FAD-dependent oxidoreductase, partial [Dehalococcoidia bacterium]|nr:FAD-dependent oxidoreductase [Dehalococcoidia bacterium]
SDALVECRRMVMEEAARLKANVPGFEDAYISLIADQLGVTESRRLRGRHILARDDLDKPFDDTIAVTGHWTKYDCVYNIPYRSLLPQRIANLLAAGRCISADHRAHHATKEIPPCIATGQAAGTAAAMAVAGNTSADAVEVRELQAKLRESGAILD